MPFAGGPYNSFGLEGVARMVVGGVPCTPSPSATRRRAGALSSAARTRRCSSRWPGRSSAAGSCTLPAPRSGR